MRLISFPSPKLAVAIGSVKTRPDSLGWGPNPTVLFHGVNLHGWSGYRCVRVHVKSDGVR